MQEELLEAHPNASLRVYAIWFDMVRSDSRSRWPRDLLTDARVLHFWDDSKAVGTWFAERKSSLRPRLGAGSEWYGGAVLWDAFLLYGPDARWDGGAADPILFGRTIVAGRESLAAELDELLKVER